MILLDIGKVLSIEELAILGEGQAAVTEAQSARHAVAEANGAPAS